MSKCNRCQQQIEKGEKYHVTKRGRHHAQCAFATTPPVVVPECLTVGELKMIFAQYPDDMLVGASRGHLSLLEVRGVSIIEAYADDDKKGMRPFKVLRLEMQ